MGRIQTQETKDKISNALKGKKQNSDLQIQAIKRRTNAREERSCPYCNTKFIVNCKNTKKYCNNSCASKHTKTGGYKEGASRGHHGKYKGIYCDSSWELAWVIYHLDNKIKFSRFKGILENDKGKYKPDFIIDNTIIEIKGDFYDKIDLERKINLAKENGYDIKLLFREDLKDIFSYVKETYKTNKFETLYDE